MKRASIRTSSVLAAVLLAGSLVLTAAPANAAEYGDSAAASGETIEVSPAAADGVSPLSVISSTKFCAVTGSTGIDQSCSVSLNHTNSNAVTIGWTEATGSTTVNLYLNGALKCTLGPSTASSNSKTCSGIGTGSLVLKAVKYASASARISMSFTI